MDYGLFQDNLENVRALLGAALPLILKWPCVLLTSGIPAMWLYPPPTWLLAWVHPAPAGSGPWGYQSLNPVLAYGADPYLKQGLGRRPDALVLGAQRGDQEGHPTPKPPAVWQWLVERGTTRRGQTILDPFLGSGTTLVAAHQLGRVCYGMEIEPRYVDVAVKRFENLTGQTATREHLEVAV